MTVSDVTVGQIGGSYECLIGNRDSVMGFVTIAQTLEDFNGVGNRRFLDLDRLETTLECRILLEVFAIFLGGRGTNGLQFATSQHRLEDRSSIDGTFGSTSTHQGVDFVDEQDDVATGLDFFQDLLEAFFEVTAITTTSNKCTKVQRVELLAPDGLRNIVTGDLLSQTFDDGGLTDTRLTDQHRVVLGTT